MVLAGSRAIPNMVRPGPRSSGAPTWWVTASTGTMVLPLAARIVLPPGITTMAWVPPWPGIRIGRSACWVTRLMGITTFWTVTPEGGVDGATVLVAAEAAVVVTAVVPAVTGGTEVWLPGELGITPSLVTT